jgi:hypothetical protein
MALNRRAHGLPPLPVPGAPPGRSATAAGPPRVRLPASYNQRAGGWLAAPRTRIAVRPAATPIHHFRTRHQGPIRSDGTGQSPVGAGGSAVVQVGPQGLGTKWSMQQAVISTTTGPADAATCQLFAGAVSIANMIGGQSYAGGGDSIGLAGLELQTGEFLIAVWAGGHPGDAATLRVAGIEDYLA